MAVHLALYIIIILFVAEACTPSSGSLKFRIPVSNHLNCHPRAVTTSQNAEHDARLSQSHAALHCTLPIGHCDDK